MRTEWPLVRVHDPEAEESTIDFLIPGRYVARVIDASDVACFERTHPAGTTFVVDGVTLWIEPRMFFSS